MRRILILVFALLVLGTPALATVTSAAQETAPVGTEAGAAVRKEPTCFGKQATVRDHVGIIKGTTGNDVIIGDDKENSVRGNGGVDRICTGGGRDFVAACGDDECSQRLLVKGGGGNDNLAGGDGDDQFFGGGGDDDISAAGGDDEIFGGKGDDILRGFTGEDVLSGGPGNDQCAPDGFDDFEPC